MEEQLISFKTVKLAKEKGLYFGVTKNWYTRTGNLNFYSPKPPYYITTQSLLQKVLREKYNIIVVALPYSTAVQGETPSYIWMIYNLTSSTATHSPFKTYEEALEKGLQAALKLIQNEK